MTRLLASVLFFVVSLASSSADAVTITRLPGSAPQTTPPNSTFPRTVGVVVRDDAGAPIAGASVVFSFDWTAEGDPYLLLLGETYDVSISNAEGVATIAAAGGHLTGDVVLKASYEGVTLPLPLSIQGSPPAHIKALSGDDQDVEPLQRLPRPWKVRVTDDRGRPAARAVVMFDGHDEPGQAGATLDSRGGVYGIYAVTDSSGIAISPGVRANANLGRGTGVACAFNTECVLFTFTIMPPAATAAIMRPLAGSTPQTTCGSCFFPNPVGVIVRDQAGRPMPGVPITFSIPWDGGALQAVDFSSNLFTMETGADGIAAPRLAAYTVNDKVTMTAWTPIAVGEVAFNLKTKEKGPENFEIVSGNGQTTQAWTDFPEPWVVRAVDRHGRAVPHAALLFAIPDQPGYPGGRFGTEEVVVVAANEAGIATSPRITANGTVGTHTGGVGPYAGDAPYAIFNYTILGVPRIGFISLVSGPPPIVEIRASTESPFVMKVTTVNGSPDFGMPVTLETDPACGSWAGNGSRVELVTDVNGLVESPIFTGIAAAAACRITATPGLNAPLQLPMHVFNTSEVVVSVEPAAIEIAAGERFIVRLHMRVDGLPLPLPTYGAVTYIPGANGSSVVDGGSAFDPNDPNANLFAFIGNGIPGASAIEFAHGAASVRLPVTQRP